MSELLRKRLYDIYAAYAEGRIDEVLRAYDDNVVMTSHAPVDIFPYLGRKQGNAAVAATMNTAHAAFEYLSYQPVFMVTEQDDAAVIVLAHLRQRATGRIIQLFIADFLRFKNGRIVELRQFMDSSMPSSRCSDARSSFQNRRISAGARLRATRWAAACPPKRPPPPHFVLWRTRARRRARARRWEGRECGVGLRRGGR